MKGPRQGPRGPHQGGPQGPRDNRTAVQKAQDQIQADQLRENARKQREQNEGKEKIKKLMTETPAKGTIGGNKFWVGEDNAAYLGDEDQSGRYVHGDEIVLGEGTPDEKRYWWNGEKSEFANESPLQEKIPKADPDSFADAQAKTDAVQNLTAALNSLERGGVISPPTIAQLREQIAALNGPNAAQKMRERVEALTRVRSPLRRG